MNYRNLFSCNGKIAVVTGGAGLLGREIVRGLRDSGAKVYLADIAQAKAKKIISGKGIKYISLDVTNENSIKLCFDKIEQENGRIDILVNCAYPRTSDWGLKFEKVSFGSWKKNIDSQLGGYFLCCQIVAGIMRKRHKGVIINFASIYGVTAPDFSIYKGTTMTTPVAYSAIKGGLINFTKYLAAYYGKDNVRVNAVSPGGIFDKQPRSFVDKYSKKTPLGRMGKPSDIVGAVVFLASDAASYVTGHNLMVDGGWTVW